MGPIHLLADTGDDTFGPIQRGLGYANAVEESLDLGQQSARTPISQRLAQADKQAMQRAPADGEAKLFCGSGLQVVRFVDHQMGVARQNAVLRGQVRQE